MKTDGTRLARLLILGATPLLIVFRKKQGYPVDVPINKRAIVISKPTRIFDDEYEPEKALSVTEFRSVYVLQKANAAMNVIADGISDGAKTGSELSKTLYSTLSFFGVITAPVAIGALAVLTLITAACALDTRGKKYSELEREIIKRFCKGTVTFYGKESDKEWASYAENGSRINTFESGIAKKEHEPKDLLVANENSIEKKIKNSIEINNNKKDELSSLRKNISYKMENFSKEVQCAYIKDKKPSSKKLPFTEKLTMIYNLCKALTIGD